METKKSRIFDVFLFLNEIDLLEIRFKTLYSVVDFFIITEINETFSGKPKELIFEKHRNRFKKYSNKIIYNPISEVELKELKSTKWVNYVSNLNIPLPHKHKGKPAKKIRTSLKREITHRDSAILGFFNLALPNDYILLSDLDEIPNPLAIEKIIKKSISKPHYFKMNWYLYWINNKVSQDWYGTVLFKFKELKGSSLDNFRFASSNSSEVPGTIIDNGGWHFSYIGGSDAIQKKLQAHPFQGYKAFIAIWLDKLKIRKFKNTLKNNKDILLQNRTLTKVKIDNVFPESILADNLFIEKYSC